MENKKIEYIDNKYIDNNLKIDKMSIEKKNELEMPENINDTTYTTAFHELIKIIQEVRKNCKNITFDKTKIPEYILIMTNEIDNDLYEILIRAFNEIKFYGSKDDIWFNPNEFSDIIGKTDVNQYIRNNFNKCELDLYTKKISIKIKNKHDKYVNCDTRIINRKGLNILLCRGKSPLCTLFCEYVNIILEKLMDDKVVELESINNMYKQNLVDIINKFKIISDKYKDAKETIHKQKQQLNIAKSDIENLKIASKRFKIKDETISIYESEYFHYQTIKELCCNNISLIIYNDSKNLFKNKYSVNTDNELIIECRQYGVEYDIKKKDDDYIKELTKNINNNKKDLAIKKSKYYDNLIDNLSLMKIDNFDNDSVNKELKKYDVIRTRKPKDSVEKKDKNISKKHGKHIYEPFYNNLDYFIDIESDIDYEENYYIGLTMRMNPENELRHQLNDNLVLKNFIGIPKCIKDVNMYNFKYHLNNMQKPIEYNKVKYYEININYIKKYFEYMLRLRSYNINKSKE